jgi:hypothetical protein
MVDLPTRTISELPQSTKILDNMEIEVNNNGQSEKVQVGQFLTKINADIRTTTNGFIGQIIQGIRLDNPRGYIRLDGATYTDASQLYPELVNAFETGKIPYINFDQYDQRLGGKVGQRQLSMCGLFAYEVSSNRFRAPKIDSRVFLANGSSIGEANWDQIVNIRGISWWRNGGGPDRHFDGFGIGYDNKLYKGILYSNNNDDRMYDYRNQYLMPEIGLQDASTNNEYMIRRCGTGPDTNAQQGSIEFNASRVVQTGDQVQPPNVQYPYFVCVNTVEANIDVTSYATQKNFNDEVALRNRQKIEIDNVLNSLDAKIAGSNSGQFFDTVQQMNNWLANPNNVKKLKVGDTLIIGDWNSPDYRWNGNATYPIPKGEIRLENYYTKTETNAFLDGKVDAREGYDLSKNDYTDIEKTRLSEAVNYQDILAAIEPLQQQLFDKEVVSNKATSIIEITTNDTLYPTTKAVSDLVESKTSTKADVKSLFTVEGNIKDIQVDNNLAEKILDLLSWVSSETPSDWNIQGTIDNGEGVLSAFELWYDATTKELKYKDNTSGTMETNLLLSDGEIQPPNTQYFDLSKSDMIVTNIVGALNDSLVFGTVQTIDITNLNDRLNLVENGSLIAGGSVDFKDTAGTMYSIYNITIADGGTGYTIGDVVKSTQTLHRYDRRAEIQVSEVDENGVVTGLIISGQNIYFEDIAVENQPTVGGTGSGLIINIETENKTGTTLASKTKKTGMYVNVLYDETSDYNGWYYICVRDEDGNLSWVKDQQSEYEERDFQIHPIILDHETVGTLQSSKIGDNLSLDKLSSYSVGTIAESDFKYADNETFTFKDYLKSCADKINGLHTKIDTVNTTLTNSKQNNLNRTVQTNLASASAITDTGGNIAPGVSGILPFVNGGTGNNIGAQSSPTYADLTQAILNNIIANIPNATEYSFIGNIKSSFGNLPTGYLWFRLRKHDSNTNVNGEARLWGNEGFEYVSSGNLTSWTSAAAVRLKTPRNINGVAFDGTKNIEVPSGYQNAVAKSVNLGNAMKAVILVTSSNQGGGNGNISTACFVLGAYYNNALSVQRKMWGDDNITLKGETANTITIDTHFNVPYNNNVMTVLWTNGSVSTS